MNLRMLVALTVTVVIGLGSIQLWRNVQADENEKVRQIAVLTAYATRSHLARRMAEHLEALDKVRRFWSLFGGLPREQWRWDAAIELGHFEGLELLLYQVSGTDIRFARSADHPGLDHRPDDAEWATYEDLLGRLEQQTESVMLGPFPSADGPTHLEVHLVNRAGDRAEGLVALIDAEKMLARMLLDEAPNYAIEVFWGDHLLHAQGEAGAGYPAQWDQEGFIRNPLGALWRVTHRPTQNNVDAVQSVAGDLVLVFGTTVAVLMGFLVYENARARQRAAGAEEAERALADLNRDLESMVEERTAALEQRTTDLETISDALAHDLRNPLGAISMNAQFLAAKLERGGLEDEIARRALDRIQPNVIVISSFLDQLMGLSALTHDSFTREPLDMRLLIEDVFETLADAEPPPPVELDLPQDLPPVEADELLVRVLLTNLIGNALKYTRDCELRRVEVAWRDCGGATEYSVIDNGVGFDMEESAGLFEAFERLSQGAESRGLGLGLSIVARVVQRHEGTIRAEGRPGAGAAFHFTLEPEKTPASDA